MSNYKQPKVLIYLKFVGYVTSQKIAIDIKTGASLKDLKQSIQHIHPQSIIHRILFAGKIIKLNDENKALTDYGIYKECSVMVFLKKCKSQTMDLKSTFDETEKEENKCWIYNNYKHENILKRLLDSINDNEINLKNTQNVNRMTEILKLNGAIITSDVPSPTLYFSDINVTEKELFHYLSHIIPNGIKCIYYNNIDGYSYFILQCKNTLMALKLLLNIKTNLDNKLNSLTSFGKRNKFNYDNNNIIEGFLQISMAQKPNYDGFAYYWCKVLGDQFEAYESLYNDAILSFSIKKIENMIIDKLQITIHIDNTTIIIRSINKVWKDIILQKKQIQDTKEGKAINIESKIAKRTSDENGIWYHHQCYLSKTQLPLFMLYSPDGHKWWADRRMLDHYICVCLKKGELYKITTRFTVSDIKDLVSSDTFDKFDNDVWKTLTKSKPQFIQCPNCSIMIELLPLSDDISQEEQIGINKLKDNKALPLSTTLQQHWRTYRVKCRNKSCMTDFCRNCQFYPYHLGDTCETMKYERCRFCDSRLIPSNRVQTSISEACKNVCASKECMNKMQLSSNIILPCGHVDIGVSIQWDDCDFDLKLLLFGFIRMHSKTIEMCTHFPSELMNLCLLYYPKYKIYPCPCLHNDCESYADAMKVTHTDYCSLCCIEPLCMAPCVLMPCNHIFHYQCIKRKLEMGPSTIYLSFTYSYCPICRVPMEHHVLKDIIDPIRELQNLTKAKALTRMKYEGLDKEDVYQQKVVDDKGEYYNDPAGFALAKLYTYFQCSQCKEPYFVKTKCEDFIDDELDKTELLCSKCSNNDEYVCEIHGKEFLGYKCRYCCKMANPIHCWSRTHFCRACQQPGVWDKLTTYCTGKNKKALEEYEQCVGIEKQLETLMEDKEVWNKWLREEKDEKISALRSDVETCPLGIKHPPNGIEFVIECTLCADKKKEAKDKLMEATLKKEAREQLLQRFPFLKNIKSGMKFEHKHPFDENGALFFLATKGTNDINEYMNPAESRMVNVNTSQLMPDSETCCWIVGRKTMRCVTKPSASCWFTVDFIDKYIQASHYTLRHYISWHSECLRHWNIEGSIDGKEWLILRQHQNDQALNNKGQAYTWRLHDYGCAFRIIRITQTGPNNNNHYFLACSGFEVYGTLYTANDSNFDIIGNFSKAYNEQQKMKQLSYIKFWKMICNGQSGVYYFDRYVNEKGLFIDDGILHFLGTKGGQTKWENPANNDEVGVSSSTLARDSMDMSYFVGRETRRLVTKNEENAWMLVDFKDKFIQPTYYSLRHYLSWHTECLRNWQLQGSNDGTNWTIIKKHENDTALNERGAVYTWPVQCKGAYRMFRIKQTGLNSNKHNYLACSGIEFLGALYTFKFDALASISDGEKCENLMQKLKSVHKCIFEYNDDKNGVAYYCGTKGNTCNWVNPAAKGWIMTDSSSLMHNSCPSYSLCGRISVRCVTRPTENAWMKIDFQNLYIIPTHYSLRHYCTWDTEALRNWILEASVDGYGWRTLRTHKNDDWLDHKGAVATWDIRAKGAKYRSFRIRQTGLNSNKHYYLACSGFEIYGDVYQISYHYATYVISSWNRKYLHLTKDLLSLLMKFIYIDDKSDISLSGDVPWMNEQCSSDVQQALQAVEVGTILSENHESKMQEKQRLIHYLCQGNGYTFNYTKDFDDCGILYFLGTDWRTAIWKNPAENGVVTVTSSTLCKDCEPVSSICGNKVVRCVCIAEKNNWFLIDFRNLYIRVTHYTLRHYASWDTECLRNWYLEGSNDLKKFKIIKKHRKDKALYGKGSSHTWNVNTEKNERYRAFRIRQYGHNSNMNIQNQNNLVPLKIKMDIAIELLEDNSS